MIIDNYLLKASMVWLQRNDKSSISMKKEHEITGQHQKQCFSDYIIIKLCFTLVIEDTLSEKKHISSTD